MSPDLTIPGDIPGLLRRGSPAFWQNGGQYEWRPCIVLRDPIKERAMCLDMDDEDSDDWHAFDCKLTQIALDPTDVTGRAHAAWWLDGHDTPYASAFDDTDWSRCAWHEYTDDWPFLADLDPNDPRLLPDGSRWVDAEALRRVVLHVAGRLL